MSAKEAWNKRFSEKEYVYGKKPNAFFKETIEKFRLSGKILLPAEGEGRNAIFVAKKGFEVTAIDISEAGKEKAETFAKEENVQIEYIVSDFSEIELPANYFDVSALIFAHLPNEIAYDCHRKIANSIKPNGYIIIEYFAKGHTEIRKTNPKIGGPDTESRLLTIKEIVEHFHDFEIIESGVFEKDFSEGKFHNGTAKVSRFIGKKRNS